MKKATYTIQINDETPQPIDLEAWLVECEFDDQERDHLRGLAPGHVTCFGGGAAPLFTIRRGDDVEEEFDQAEAARSMLALAVAVKRSAGLADADRDTKVAVVAICYREARADGLSGDALDAEVRRLGEPHRFDSSIYLAGEELARLEGWLAAPVVEPAVGSGNRAGVASLFRRSGV